MIRKKAMDLLARREHSEQELRQKLKSRGYEFETIDEVVQGLKSDCLLSDERFFQCGCRAAQDSLRITSKGDHRPGG
jgi:regulatory protein